MSCNYVRRLCNRLVISTAVTFADGTLIINLPAGNYSNRERYCIVVGQAIPATATITAPVVITIGEDTTEYPLVNADCTTMYACSINSRTRYSVCVFTDVAGGVFKLLGRLPCSRCGDNLASLPAPAAVTSGA